MQAITVKEPGDLLIETVIKPELTETTDVLVKVKAAGICGSDMHIYHGSNPFTVYPRVIGHEVAGVVEEVGEDVHDLTIGDTVALEPISYCGECYACRKGRQNVCEKLEVFGVHQDGGMREWMVAPESKWHKLNPTISYEAAALVEPLTIGAQATSRGGVEANDTVFIMGAGPTGLSCLILAKQKGAKVFISDFNQSRLDYAKEIGADVLINARTADVHEVITKGTNGELSNVVIDAVGTAETFAQAVTLASVAGTVVALGFNENPSPIASLFITKKELTIVGSRLQANKFKEMIQLVNEGVLKPEEMISHRYEMANVQEAFDKLEKEPDQIRKIVLTF